MSNRRNALVLLEYVRFPIKFGFHKNAFRTWFSISRTSQKWISNEKPRTISWTIGIFQNSLLPLPFLSKACCAVLNAVPIKCKIFAWLGTITKLVFITKHGDFCGFNKSDCTEFIWSRLIDAMLRILWCFFFLLKMKRHIVRVIFANISRRQASLIRFGWLGLSYHPISGY